MYQTLRDHYCWLSMAPDVFDWVGACPTCVKETGVGVLAAIHANVTSENESTNEILIRPGD